MTKMIVNPTPLPRPSGFSHGIVSEGGRTLYLAGQPGVNAQGQIAAPGDLLAQFSQALANIQSVVTVAGGTMQDIVKLTFFVLDADAYKAVLKPLGVSFRTFFGGYYPATTLVEVRGLFDEHALIEIEGIAVID
jgi:enamine deaminase RidA (YjgF/YER057c/UK114 family)